MRCIPAFAAFAIVVSGSAMAQPIKGAYVSFGAGMNIEDDSSQAFTYEKFPGLPSYLQVAGPGPFPITLEHGYAVSGAVGYGLGNGLRLEVEGSYRSNPLNTSLAYGNPLKYSGNDQKTSVILSVNYDMDIGLPVFPYVGVGAGMAHNAWTNVTRSGTNLIQANAAGQAVTTGMTGTNAINDSQNVLALQFTAGLSYPIASIPGLSLTADYKYFAMPNKRSFSDVLTFSCPAGAVCNNLGRTLPNSGAGYGTYGAEYNHTLMAGIRYAFGGPTPAKEYEAGSLWSTEGVTNENLLWYRIQPFSHDPFVNDPNNAKRAKDIVKHMFHYEHTDTGGIVWNSLTITGLFADAAESADGGAIPAPTLASKNGARELYMTYRGDISRTGFGGKPISFPGVADTMFEFGGDMNYKDDQYQARRRFLVAGPIFYFDLPGSVTLAVHVAQEFNHDGITGQDTHYHPTWNTELSYTEYFDEDHIVRWEGVFNMTGAKGWDTTLSKTTTEYYTYNQIAVDVGPMINLPPHKLDLFGGIQFWYNKFGYPAVSRYAGGGAVELTPYFGMAVHF
jgi:opacity protein-like surface antigen